MVCVGWWQHLLRPVLVGTIGVCWAQWLSSLNGNFCCELESNSGRPIVKPFIEEWALGLGFPKGRVCCQLGVLRTLRVDVSVAMLLDLMCCNNRTEYLVSVCRNPLQSALHLLLLLLIVICNHRPTFLPPPRRPTMPSRGSSCQWAMVTRQ